MLAILLLFLYHSSLSEIALLFIVLLSNAWKVTSCYYLHYSCYKKAQKLKLLF